MSLPLDILDVVSPVRERWRDPTVRRPIVIAGACVLAAVLAACADADPRSVPDDPDPVPATATATTAEPAPAETPSSAPAIRATPARVARVVDGDTIEVRIDGRTERVRFIGIDTPERGTPLASSATSFTSRHAGPGATVFLQLDVEERDRYGRLLAYVWLRLPTDDTDEDEIASAMLNAMLLRQGLATLLTIPPNIKYVDAFRTIQDVAHQNGKNLWAARPASGSTTNSTGSCHPSYSGKCLKPDSPDYDCAGGSGDGPDYVEGPVYVDGDDPYQLDRNGDGVACE